MKKIILMALLICIAATALVFGQGVDIKKMAGYVDIEKIKIPKSAECTTEINLGPGLLGMLKNLADEEDDEDYSGLFSIRVKSYEIQREHVQKIRDAINDMEEKLVKDQWENVLRTRDRESYAIISVKIENGKSMGAVIMTVDDDEATFVNIVGSVDFEKLTELGLGLNDSTLNVLRSDWDSK